MSSRNDTNDNGLQGSDSYVPLTTYAIHKSYGGWPNFMHCHGLKEWDLHDQDTAKRIVEGIKQDHREEWEEERRSMRRR
ncbi:hypothetical protein FA15DRAFT_517388 [Coprinopsis marcescibilis]|uniref:Uncharacterized protein n=1 Tax=Coprinopsis marcescibilis TaxID=230819 RepID=A0A5C3KRK9_COPMA|nr:hypothetical protein FA15DRAFT_517388 [Coprinopsis marcescibilis]